MRGGEARNSRQQPGFRALVLTFVLGGALSACDRDSPPPIPSAGDRPELPARPPPRIPSAAADSGRDEDLKLLEQVLALDGDSGVVATGDPLAPAGDLKREIQAFTTLDACVAEHARLDPLVGDALRAIGYDSFLKDACRILEAAKRGSAEPCLAIDATALRNRCVSTVAIVQGAPDMCPPSLGSKPNRGRDPTCIAAATRDARLCSAEDASKRTTCEALTLSDARRCESNAFPPERRACARDVERFRAVLGKTSAQAKPFEKPAGTVHVEPSNTRDAGGPSPVTLNIEAILRKGVTSSLAGEAVHLEFGTPEAHGAVHVTPSRTDSPNVAFTIETRASDPKGATSVIGRIERFEISIPGDVVLVCPAMKCTLEVKTEGNLRARSEPVKIHIEGEVGSGPSARTILLEATTFIRDVMGTPSAARSTGGGTSKSVAPSATTKPTTN